MDLSFLVVPKFHLELTQLMEIVDCFLVVYFELCNVIARVKEDLNAIGVGKFHISIKVVQDSEFEWGREIFFEYFIDILNLLFTIFILSNYLNKCIITFPLESSSLINSLTSSFFER